MPLRPCLDCQRPTEGNRCDKCKPAVPTRPRTPEDRQRDRLRDRERGTANERGYGATHQAVRRGLEPLVASGRAFCTEPICLEPDRRIKPGSPWDLAHNRSVPGTYHGPAHSRCNRAEGARFRAKSQKI